ncbi:MAG: helix-turn-helix transcriptional regulator [Myxococcales bacterium]
MSSAQVFGSAVAPNDYVSVLEACYAHASSHQAWAQSVLQALQGATGSRVPLGLVVVHERAQGANVELAEFVNLGPPPGLTPCAPLDAAQLGFLQASSGALVPSSQFARHMPPSWAAWTKQNIREHGLDELWFALAHPSTELCLLLIFGVLDPGTFVRRQRDAFERVAIHVESMLRLRFADHERPAALVRLDGHVERVEQTAFGRPRADVLVRGMHSIERAKRERELGHGERALRAWPALVEGNWSLVERTDGRGQRAYWALLNPPVARAKCPLGEREAGILELSARGFANTHVAYALGLSPSYVSSVLSVAAARLGYKGRADLLRAVAASPESSRAYSASDLTTAERKVLELVQQGLSNLQIANARGTAERTVANQVAALMKKTGANSRRSLIVMR